MLGLVTAALVAVVWLSSEEPSGLDSGTELVVAAGWMLVVAAVVGAVQAWIVRRPQPHVDPDVVEADDACRAASIRILACLATALGYLGLSILALFYIAAFDGPTEWTAGVAGYACLWCAACTWRARRTPLPGRGRGWNRDQRRASGALPA